MLGVSRSGYYAYCRRPVSAREQANKALLEQIGVVYEESRKRYGSPRIHAELRARGVRCSKHRVARLMQKAGMKAKVHKRQRFNPCVHYDYPQGKNQLARCFHTLHPNRIWVGDITYIPTEEGWLYLAVILDLYSRKVVGYTMLPHMRKELALNALEQAVIQRQPQAGLMFHSDRGMQYVCDHFQDRLRSIGAISSMSRKGNCYDNAVAESFFHTLKTELVARENYRTRQEARASIFEYIAVFYNNKRRHSYLNYLTPTEFERDYGEA